MKRTYESVVIFDGSLPDETITKEREKIEKFLSENGELQKTEAWGKRSLAYEIKKKRIGTYFLFIFQGEGAIIEQLSRLYKLNFNILRHLNVLYEELPKLPERAVHPQSSSEEGEEEE